MVANKHSILAPVDQLCVLSTHAAVLKACKIQCRGVECLDRLNLPECKLTNYLHILQIFLCGIYMYVYVYAHNYSHEVGSNQWAQTDSLHHKVPVCN